MATAFEYSPNGLLGSVVGGEFWAKIGQSLRRLVSIEENVGILGIFPFKIRPKRSFVDRNSKSVVFFANELATILLGYAMTEQDRHDLFSEMIARHRDELYAYILAIVRNCDDADDLFQSVCLVLWNKFVSFVPGSSFFAWARQTAKIEVRYFLRCRPSPNHVSEELLDTLAEEVLDSRLDVAESYLEALQRCRTKLNAADEELLELRYVEDLGSRDIADRVERPQQSVCQSLKRVRRWLLECVRLELARQEHSGRGAAMKDAGPYDRALDLTEAVCDSEASTADMAELDTILLADGASRRGYLEYYRLHVALRQQLRAHRAARNVCEQIHVAATVPPLMECVAAPIEADTSVPSSLSGPVFHGYWGTGWPVAYLVATVMTVVGLWVCANTYISPPGKVAGQRPSEVESRVTPVCKTTAPVIGRITGMLDCRWAGARGSENVKSETRSLKSPVLSRRPP